jgi:plastocyanin
MRTLLAAVLVAATVPAPASSASPAPAPPASAVVHIHDDAFVPPSLTVRAGTRVTFVNDDDDAHTATADDQSWDSEGLNLGQRWAQQFGKAGTVRYHCTVHPNMHGTIVVRSAP